ncbi:MAG TPA: FHA domain-containing protein [Anaerolineaceae bacterium]
MSTEEGKFCPACKLRNDVSATTCIYCGVPFEIVTTGSSNTTTKMTVGYSRPTVENDGLPDQYVREIPDKGLAIYRINFIYPFDVRLESDFIIGRKTNGAPEELLDLSPLEGYIMGVSKQHVRIQVVGNGYQITDLGSTNGTWVNEVRLSSNQPAILPNAARVRMGRMELDFIYRPRNT